MRWRANVLPVQLASVYCGTCERRLFDSPPLPQHTHILSCLCACQVRDWARHAQQLPPAAPEAQQQHDAQHADRVQRVGPEARRRCGRRAARAPAHITPVGRRDDYLEQPRDRAHAIKDAQRVGRVVGADARRELLRRVSKGERRERCVNAKQRPRNSRRVLALHVRPHCYGC